MRASQGETAPCLAMTPIPSPRHQAEQTASLSALTIQGQRLSFFTEVPAWVEANVDLELQTEEAVSSVISNLQ